ncbi:MAG: hypothetical protein JWO36_385 [Myxococcales bacterium]|nr:hypothetical protein [Myxococcales bacterium]
MGLLTRFGGVGFGLGAAMIGCYSPDLRDCTVACSTASDCASGQMCGTDQFCAAPSVAGHCAKLARSDAGTVDGLVLHDGAMPHVDARPPDAPAPADAAPAPTIQLHIVITGKGRVVVNGSASCDSSGPQHGNCLLAAPISVPAMLQASGHQQDSFDGWTTQACAGQGATCTFTPTTDTLVGVHFAHHQQGGD